MSFDPENSLRRLATASIPLALFCDPAPAGRPKNILNPFPTIHSNQFSHKNSQIGGPAIDAAPGGLQPGHWLLCDERHVTSFRSLRKSSATSLPLRVLCVPWLKKTSCLRG